MSPLVVTAHLVRGYSARDPWSPALEGILAYALMRERLSPDDFAAQAAQPTQLAPVEGLPLERVTFEDAWWWACSSPDPVGNYGRERRHFHRRFDDQHERHLVDGVRTVMTAAGPYKSARLSDVRVLCRALRWSVVGEAGEIARLLDGVIQVGRRRGVGYGEVSRWEVSLAGEAEAEAARWRRPVPAAAAAARGLSGPTMPWGLTPPSYAPACQALCVMPT